MNIDHFFEKYLARPVDLTNDTRGPLGDPSLASIIPYEEFTNDIKSLVPKPTVLVYFYDPTHPYSWSDFPDKRGDNYNRVTRHNLEWDCVPEVVKPLGEDILIFSINYRRYQETGIFFRHPETISKEEILVAANRSSNEPRQRIRHCFLVVGPEGSGTRMMTDALISVGCFEEVVHYNARKEPSIYPHRQRIVFRRSLPHSSPEQDAVWPDLKALRQMVEYFDYQVQPILMIRDWHAMISSQNARAWFTEDAAANIQRAIRTVTDQLPDFIPVTYEAFCLSEGFQETLFTKYLGLPATPPIQIWYANDKYYPGADEIEVTV